MRSLCLGPEDTEGHPLLAGALNYFAWQVSEPSHLVCTVVKPKVAYCPRLLHSLSLSLFQIGSRRGFELAQAHLALFIKVCRSTLAASHLAPKAQLTLLFVVLCRLMATPLPLSQRFVKHLIMCSTHKASSGLTSSPCSSTACVSLSTSATYSRSVVAKEEGNDQAHAAAENTIFCILAMLKIVPKSKHTSSTLTHHHRERGDHTGARRAASVATSLLFASHLFCPSLCLWTVCVCVCVARVCVACECTLWV